uniref:DUF295 domain-containing protein n=1 Tax=Panagrellus redivivus TaxID=6233 RepID=A0A7E4ZTM7_PANRE
MDMHHGASPNQKSLQLVTDSRSEAHHLMTAADKDWTVVACDKVWRFDIESISRSALNIPSPPARLSLFDASRLQVWFHFDHKGRSHYLRERKWFPHYPLPLLTDLYYWYMGLPPFFRNSLFPSEAHSPSNGSAPRPATPAAVMSSHLQRFVGLKESHKDQCARQTGN